MLTYSFDDSSQIDYIPYKCPICYNIIWRNVSTYTCNKCQNKLCYHCLNNILNNDNNNCPFCRERLKHLISISEEYNLNDEEYDLNDEEYNLNDGNYNINDDKCRKKNIFLIIGIVLLFINMIYLLSLF